MRGYNKRFIAQKMQRISKGRIETMNAVITAVYPAQRRCTVKIQGSTRQITAWFPQNSTELPDFVHINNGVTLRHTGGREIGRLEVVGHGELVPSTFVAADASSGDAVLSGMQPVAGNADMTVTIPAGTYRINGVVYTFGGSGSEMTMSETSDITMSEYSEYVMSETGGAGAVLTFTAPAAGYFRYDLIVVGTDGVAEIVQGTAATSSPAMPATPGNHLKICHVLLYGGMTAITNKDINSLWSVPVPSSLTAVLSGTTTWTIAMTVRDQYGNTIGMVSPGWYFTVQQAVGDGLLHSAQEGDSPTQVGYRTTSGTANITYTPEADPIDPEPFFICQAAGGDYQLLTAIGRDV